MNIFSEGINGEFAVGPDDADMLLRMVEEAHQPFGQRPYVGDIANEWRRRWSKSKPKPQEESMVAARYSANAVAAAQALKEAYSGTGKRLEAESTTFPLDVAIIAISARWPGIDIGRPEADWNKRPEIAELRQMRMALVSQRDLPASDSLKSGGHLATSWR